MSGSGPVCISDCVKMAKEKKPKAQSGLQFVFTNGAGATDAATRKRIRSHVMQGKNRKKQLPKFPAWLGEPVSPASPASSSSSGDAPHEYSNDLVFIPPNVGTAHSFTNFPVPMEKYMLQDAITFMNVTKRALYPFEICLRIDPRERIWFDFLFRDPAFLHSVISTSEAYHSLQRGGGMDTPRAVYHIIKALEILSERIAVGVDDAVADSTISVVISLVMAADLSGDFAAAENHMRGLYKLTAMRGGIKSLEGDTWGLQTKILRADLGHAIGCGSRPLFLTEEISWEPYITTHSPIAKFDPPKPEGGLADVNTFIDGLDWRLVNVWKDLREFSMVGNLAYQTQRRIEADTFHEMLISIQYRLLHLKFNNDTANEAIRLGLLSYATTIFLQWGGVSRIYDHLGETYKECLRKLKGSSDVPPWLAVWLVVVGHISVFDEADDPFLQQWLNEALPLTGVQSWEDGRKVLRSIMWIDLLHDRPGQAVFQEVVARTNDETPAKPIPKPLTKGKRLAFPTFRRTTKITKH